MITGMLNSDPEIKVAGTAVNGTDAIKKIPKLRPDCITLDLAMPYIEDGLHTLKQIMSEFPTPVVILSAHSRENADITIDCLNAGAVSFILKPYHSGILHCSLTDFNVPSKSTRLRFITSE